MLTLTLHWCKCNLCRCQNFQPLHLYLFGDRLFPIRPSVHACYHPASPSADRFLSARRYRKQSRHTRSISENIWSRQLDKRRTIRGECTNPFHPTNGRSTAAVARASTPLPHRGQAGHPSQNRLIKNASGRVLMLSGCVIADDLCRRCGYCLQRPTHAGCGLPMGPWWPQDGERRTRRCPPRERTASGRCAACVVKPTGIEGTSGAPRRHGGVANGAGGANTHQIRVTGPQTVGAFILYSCTPLSKRYRYI